MPDFVGQVQAATRGAQLQRTQLVFIGQGPHLENQCQGQTGLEVSQLYWQLPWRR
ncbi:hypothetical protein D3C75_1303250 [compost metagenome]